MVLAYLHTAGHSVCSANVLCPHAGTQTILNIIGTLDHLQNVGGGAASVHRNLDVVFDVVFHVDT